MLAILFASGFALFRDATLKYKSLKHNGTDLVSSRAETSLSIFLVFVFLIVVKTAFEHKKNSNMVSSKSESALKTVEFGWGSQQLHLQIFVFVFVFVLRNEKHRAGPTWSVPSLKLVWVQLSIVEVHDSCIWQYLCLYLYLYLWEMRSTEKDQPGQFQA